MPGTSILEQSVEVVRQSVKGCNVDQCPSVVSLNGIIDHFRQGPVVFSDIRITVETLS